MSRKVWTPEEDAAIAKYYPGHGNSEELRSALPDRTPRAISMRACQLGIQAGVRGPRSWRPEEDKVAVALLARACRETGRTPLAVIRRLEWLVRKAQARGKAGAR